LRRINNDAHEDNQSAAAICFAARRMFVSEALDIGFQARLMGRVVTGPSCRSA
jgi:hypothetical protein